MHTEARQFLTNAAVGAANAAQRAAVKKAVAGYEATRERRKARYQDWEHARDAAAAVRREAIEHLDEHLPRLIAQLESRGAQVFVAADAARARQYIVDLARRKSARSVIKSKTMTSEEIDLNAALHAAGVEPIESDLGEFIVQLRGEKPFHFVSPILNLTRAQVSQTFHEKLGVRQTDDVQELTMTARRFLRAKYCTADIGVTGANFAVAQTGTISITENEGNARLTSSLPKVHVVLVGIEKIIPRLQDLALFLPMLATSGAGQGLTCYNSLISGPRQRGESDGPEEMHVVLLDNGRTNLLADVEQRQSLHCIRCGACLNACPVFRTIGGHAYGTTYQGPIGSVITPHFLGLARYQHLSQASSLCGACTSVCPVKIDLHHHLLRNRRNAVRQVRPRAEGLAVRAYCAVARRPWMYRLLGRILRVLAPGMETAPGMPSMMSAWFRHRAMPVIPAETFRARWSRRGKEADRAGR